MIQELDLEEWVMNIFHNDPMILPFTKRLNLMMVKTVAVVSFPIGISKPYVLRHSGRKKVPYIRVGTTHA